MARIKIEKYRQAANELRNHLNSQRYRQQKPERAFIDWFILARFGKPSDVHMLDGSKDGGIDEIIVSDGISYVIQSKYEVVTRVSVISRKEISDFEGIAQRFKDTNSDDDFSKWLKKARPAIQPIYKKLRTLAQQNSRKVRFVFITTKRFQLEASDLVEVEDIQNISSLWYLYREGFTPPTEFIELGLEAAPPKEEEGFTTYVGLADARDFLRLMEDDKNERLFAQNVRTDLRSQINKDIRRTYEMEPDKFWLGNNGIYIVCKNVTSTGNTYRLTYPSIINGSQTLHSIYSSSKRHSCKILVRILKMDVLGNPSLLSSVIRRTNTQNPMKLLNLSAHDPFQLNIARYLDRYKIFYERREKEWTNEKKTMLVDYVPVNIKDVAQWLSTLHQDIGFGRARSRVAELFQTRFYKEIFGDFDSEFKSTAYKSLASIVWSGLFVQMLLYYLKPNTKKFGKMSQLLLVRAVYDSVNRSPELHSQIETLFNNHRYGSRWIPSHTRTVVKGFVKKFIQIQKTVQKRDFNIDFSNFFKRDDLTKIAYRRVCSNKSLQKLSKSIERHINQIE